MKVITAPENYKITSYDVKCFLAGGITGCHDWQKELIEELDKYGLDDLTLFNPKREKFDTSDRNATYDQICWEFAYLNSMDIFSVYFTKDTLQPITLYELGRYIEVMKNTFPRDYEKRIIISMEPGYERADDVIIQTNLAFDECKSDSRIPNIWYQASSIEQHAKEIFKAYSWINRKW